MAILTIYRDIKNQCQLADKELSRTLQSLIDVKLLLPTPKEVVLMIPLALLDFTLFSLLFVMFLFILVSRLIHSQHNGLQRILCKQVHSSTYVVFKLWLFKVHFYPWLFHSKKSCYSILEMLCCTFLIYSFLLYRYHRYPNAFSNWILNFPIKEPNLRLLLQFRRNQYR